jgi:hypothetical protein
MAIPYITCDKFKFSGEAKNSKGIPIPTYSEEVEIKGYMGSGQDNIINVAGKDTIETRWKFFTTDFTINLGDRVNYQGETYEIIGQPRNTAFKNHHIKTTVRKIDNVKQL